MNYDDTLDYIQEHYALNQQEIISSEYLVSGKDEQGEYVIYEVTTQDNKTHFVRLDVTFHKYPTKIGSDFRIHGMIEISDYEMEVRQ